MSSIADDAILDHDDYAVESTGKDSLPAIPNSIDVSTIFLKGPFKPSPNTVRTFGCDPTTAAFRLLQSSLSVGRIPLEQWMDQSAGMEPWSTHQLPSIRPVLEANETTQPSSQHLGPPVTLKTQPTVPARITQAIKPLSPSTLHPLGLSTVPDYPWFGAGFRLALGHHGLIDSMVDRRLNQQPSATEAPYIKPTIQEPYFVNKILSPQALPFRQSPSHDTSASNSKGNSAGYRNTVIGRTAQGLLDQSLLKVNQQSQQSSKNHGNGRPKDNITLKTTSGRGRSIHCWHYFSASMCPCKNRYVAPLRRHARRHQFWFCGKCCKHFVGRSARDEYLAHGHGDQVCIDLECPRLSTTQFGHQRTPICILWNDLAPKQKWLSIFALIFPGVQPPSWDVVHIVDESVYSPISSEESRSSISTMTVEPQPLLVDSFPGGGGGGNVQMHQQVPWPLITSLTNRVATNGAQESNAQELPHSTTDSSSGMGADMNFNPSQLDELVEQNNQLREDANQLTQSNILLRNIVHCLWNTHHQLLQVDSALFPRSDVMLAMLVERQNWLLISQGLFENVTGSGVTTSTQEDSRQGYAPENFNFNFGANSDTAPF